MNPKYGTASLYLPPHSFNPLFCSSISHLPRHFPCGPPATMAVATARCHILPAPVKRRACKQPATRGIQTLWWGRDVSWGGGWGRGVGVGSREVTG